MVLETYRGRNQMTLEEFILDVEKTQFRSPFDTGANPCAMMVWNLLREWAGMERLTTNDLIFKYALDNNWTFERAEKEYKDLREWQRTR